MDMRDMSPTDRIERLEIMIQMVQGDTRELRGRQNQLESQWGQFIPLVADQIGRKVLAPWLSSVITIPDSLNINENDDPLNLDNITMKEKGGMGKT